MPKPSKRAWGYLNKQDYCVILFEGCCSKTFPFFFKKWGGFFYAQTDQASLGFGHKKNLPASLKGFWSGWQDSNLRPPAPKAGAITGLRYTPKSVCKYKTNLELS